MILGKGVKVEKLLCSVKRVGLGKVCVQQSGGITFARTTSGGAAISMLAETGMVEKGVGRG